MERATHDEADAPAGAVAPGTRSGLQEFFDGYGRALASGDPDGIAIAFDYPSLVLGGPVPVVLSGPAAIHAALAGDAEPDPLAGFTEVDARIDHVDDAAVGGWWVAVHWTYRPDDGSGHWHEAYRYLVRPVAHGFVITALARVPCD